MTDTIIAIATPPQNGAIGILRLSGPLAKTEALKFFRDPQGQKISDLKPRHFLFGHLVNEHEQILDDCLVVLMPTPHSYTGEDVVEFHCHGNLLLLKKILKLFLDHTNIRAAEPGEFTKRAFLNGRMDLAQAESVHEIITAESEVSLKASLKNLDGRLSKIIHNMRDQFKTALALVEASFEFSEEDIQTFDRNEILALLKKSHKDLLQLEQAYQTSKLYDHGVSVAIVGKPNVGKSSLLNALMVEERAIVTEIPGTTRDVVEGSRVMGGVRFIFRDTAGLRETQDIVESAGIRRSQEWIEKSDIVIFVVDSINRTDENNHPSGSWLAPASKIDMPPGISILSQFSSSSARELALPRNTGASEIIASPSHPKGPGSFHQFIFTIFNKTDLILGENPDANEIESFCAKHGFDTAISAKTGFGLEKIETLLLASLEKKDSPENVIHVNERQRHAILKSAKVVEGLLGSDQVGANNDLPLHQEELLAEELRHVIRHLEEITGEITNEEVLGEIFRRFCIGK